MLLIRELEAVASGEIDRLMVFMPPGSAKSTYASVLFPPWFMARFPAAAVIGASNTAELAEDFSKRVQGMVREHQPALGYGLSNQSASLWHTTAGGRYRAAGVGGTITGFRADLAIIDDPIKGREEADSDRIRDKAWNWYRADFVTRLKPGGRIVLIQTRWHEDDLAGRLLQTEASDWRVLKLPALALQDDPLGRAPGEALWPGWEDAAALERKRRTLGERDWTALFQQDPRPLEGGLFKVGQLREHVGDAPGVTVRGWDLAATEQVGTSNPDWTVGVKMTRMPDGRFVVADVVRLRGGPDEVEAAIVRTAALDGRGVTISLPQDPGQAGKQQVLYLTRKLAGFRVSSSPETGDKATRAAPAASQVNGGNVSMVPGLWREAFVEELRSFPSGAKDDQVDAMSRAFNALIAPPGASRGANIPFMGR